MLKVEKDLVNLIEDGQSGKYDKTASVIKSFVGNIKTIMKFKYPLEVHLLIYQIDCMLQIINPDLQEAIKWFNDVKDALKNWHNDIIISNRILGIYDDNFYDTTVFEKAIMQHFFLSKKPKGEQTITITFNRMVELVELGARRFNY